MSSPKALPTPRELLTDLISTLSSQPPPPTQKPSTNPLQNAPPEVRSLLTTLHIIFPHLLLPALDLLDRHLVSKVSQQPPHAGIPASRTASSAPPPPSPMEQINSFYLVQSSQSTTRRHQKSYTIRLHAWNCTCASFAFSAFPPSASSETTPLPQDITYPTQDETGKWEFGGLSTDGKDGGAVPACKHLLACVLVDRWGVLGKMVGERWAGKEEMAGLGAGF